MHVINIKVNNLLEMLCISYDTFVVNYVRSSIAIELSLINKKYKFWVALNSKV